jgi:hypothetical protein
VVSTRRANAGIVWVSTPGDYATLNSNHTPDGTPLLVCPHQPRIGHDIGGEDSSEKAFDRLFHASPSRVDNNITLILGGNEFRRKKSGDPAGCGRDDRSPARSSRALAVFAAKKQPSRPGSPQKPWPAVGTNERITANRAAQ